MSTRLGAIFIAFLAAIASTGAMAASPPTVSQSIVSATASAYDTTRGRVPGNAIDGDTTSKWTVLSMPQWIVLDLGTTRAVSQVRILIYCANAGQNMDFNVEVSMDNLNWSTVIYHATPVASPQWTEVNFSPVQTRYLRVSLNSTNKKDYANVYEIEVYGQGFNAGSELVPSTILTLSWQPTGDSVDGYIVYYGPAADTVNTEVTTTLINSPGINLLAPSVKLNSWSDLGLLPGNNICFTVRAYNADGLSGPSTPVCGHIPNNL